MEVIEDSNITTVNRFILLGLADTPYLKAINITAFLIIYIVTLSVNSLLIIMVRISLRLHTPMYFFLCILSIVDISLSSTTVPKSLVITLTQDKSVSVFDCALQMFFHSALGATECIILAVMAYDRYVAICKPLHYNTVMNKTFCICITGSCWAVGCINSGVQVVYTFQLPFCRSHQVNHFFCEVPPFLRLSCRDTWFNEVSLYISGSTIGLCSLSLTLISYVYIISTIFNIRSIQGRHRAFSTCTSHLIVISLFYGTLIFMYLLPRSRYSPDTDKTVSIIYTVVIPMLNPIIYSIRNADIKKAIREKLTSHQNL
ncbi:hypothetical protein XELAEV_18040423mg [Xenopus laevis]|nr:hypothetical protein XELAEV_18040423mg [Xenopus laevis]